MRESSSQMHVIHVGWEEERKRERERETGFPSFRERGIVEVGRKWVLVGSVSESRWVTRGVDAEREKEARRG